MAFYEKLKWSLSESQEKLFSNEEILSIPGVIVLHKFLDDSILVGKQDDNAFEFALFRFARGDLAGTDREHTISFVGCGFPWEGEVRHIYFGEEGGYIYYPDINYLCTALTVIKEVFASHPDNIYKVEA